MKIFYYLIILLFSSFQAYCQPNSGLHIGNSFPNIEFKKIINYKSPTASFSDFKGKLLILDFMYTTCGPCISILPSLDSLQSHFKTKMQIILVSPENPEIIRAFLKKRPNLHLPFVANDTTLSKLFPHVYISHIAWINPKGIVNAITYSEYINAKNIEALLSGERINWPVKREIPDYDFTQPLLKLNVANMPEESFPAKYYYTAIINYLPGVQKNNIVVADSVNNLTHTSLINYSILELYEILYNRIRLPFTQIIIRVKKEDRLIYNSRKEYFDVWKKKNNYCIEATLPGDIPPAEQKMKLIKDLDFYLGLNSILVKRKVNCVVLKNFRQTQEHSENTKTKSLRLGSIVGLLNNRINKMPLIDETTGTIYLNLPITESQIDDYTYLKKILYQYGIEMVTEKREIEFLVITQS